MGRLSLPTTGLVYIDTAPIIYSVEKIEPYSDLLVDLWKAVADGRITIISSELTLLEVLVGPRKHNDHDLELIYRRLLRSARGIQLVPIVLEIIEAALTLRAQTNLKTPDAIHAATALQTGCSHLVTNDRSFSRVGGVSVIALRDHTSS